MSACAGRQTRHDASEHNVVQMVLWVEIEQG